MDTLPVNNILIFIKATRKIGNINSSDQTITDSCHFQDFILIGQPTLIFLLSSPLVYSSNSTPIVKVSS